MIAPGKGGNRLVAVNASAEAAGLRVRMLLTDATAIEPSLKTVPQDAQGEAADLKRMAHWCRRYSPWVAVDGSDGVWLDLTGVAHLFGGERALLRDLINQLQRAGFVCHAAIASTHAAAWSMARYASSSLSIIPHGEEKQRLLPLPIRALAIAEDKAVLLDRLGLKSIGQLCAIPRANLRARFGDDLCTRLDQCLGVSGEALTSLAYEPLYFHRLDFHEPVVSLDAIGQAARLLVEQVAAQLQRDGKAARAFTITLFDTQGNCADVNLALTQSSNAINHILRLFRERFTALESRFDDVAAFDAATLFASRVESVTAVQTDWGGDKPRKDERARNQLFDRLTAKLGHSAVTRFAFRESHIPERASISVPILQKTNAPPSPRATAPRPFLLLPRAEPVTVIAELPDYPPRRFIWRRLSHRVIRAEGPERIEAEWWKPGKDDAPPRDYFTVEDEAGRRFWLYREGLYADPDQPPQWFMHGLFA